MKIIPHLPAILAAVALAAPLSAGALSFPGGAQVQLVGMRLAPDSGGAPSPGNSRRPAPNLQNPGAAVDADGQSAFLRLKIPKQSVYVGELVPVEVKAYFRDGAIASLDGLPVLGGDAFAIGKLTDKPAQTEETINGEPYTVLTWESALSAVKAGDYPLSLDLPVVVRVQEKGHRKGRNPLKDFFGGNSPFGSMFDDSFFDDFFGNVVEKPLTLHTKASPMHVLALPSAGRPANFSGAVGSFDISAEAPSASATAGDPLTLKIKITGQGNFARVSTTGLARSAAWKTYRPSGKFEASDNAGISGTKTFEQAVIPTQSGAQQIPALTFSYFDPATGQYVTKQSDPIALTVAAGDPSMVAAAVSAPVSETSAVDATPIADIHPLIFRPWFFLVNIVVVAILAVTLLGQWILRLRSRDSRRLAREAMERSLRESLGQMDNAVQASDSMKFFAVARQTVQDQLAEHWHLPAIEITPALITRRLHGNGEEIRTLFRTADEAAYCGRRFTPAELQQWHVTVKEQLQTIPAL